MSIQFDGLFQPEDPWQDNHWRCVRYTSTRDGINETVVRWVHTDPKDRRTPLIFPTEAMAQAECDKLNS